MKIKKMIYILFLISYRKTSYLQKYQVITKKQIEDLQVNKLPLFQKMLR